MAPLERAGLRRWRRRLWARVPRGGRGLEVGAGTGANCGLHPDGAVVTTDVSWRMLARASEKPACEGRLFVVSDVQALPFRDAAFDWVAETFVFCEVPDPDAGLREVRRVLRPGGTFLLLEHVRPGGALGVGADLLTAITRPLWGEHFNRDTEAAVRAAGFEVTRREQLWRDLFVLLVARAPAAPALPSGSS